MAMAIAARDEKDPQKRLDFYVELQKHLMHNSPYAIMMQPSTTVACRTGVEGMRLCAISSGHSYTEVTKS